MNEQTAQLPAPRVRLAHADDDEFILGLAERFVSFELPPWRRRGETLSGIRGDIARNLRDLPPASHLFVAEDDAGQRMGFLHLQTQKDFFTGALNCHISDIVVAGSFEGCGVGSALLEFAEHWAKEHRCRFITLGVFPANARAIGMYERHGYGTELLRMVKPVR
jgi:ribosomal protein S18 acetylase RimI-like enzyme